MIAFCVALDDITISMLIAFDFSACSGSWAAST